MFTFGVTRHTDNLPYGKSLVKILHEAGFKSFEDGSGVDVLVSVGHVHLMEGMPGAESGYAQGTESYFDRLWQRGEKSRRFYLSVVKQEHDLNVLTASGKRKGGGGTAVVEVKAAEIAVAAAAAISIETPGQGQELTSDLTNKFESKYGKYVDKYEY